LASSLERLHADPTALHSLAAQVAELQRWREGAETEFLQLRDELLQLRKATGVKSAREAGQTGDADAGQPLLVRDADADQPGASASADETISKSHEERLREATLARHDELLEAERRQKSEGAFVMDVNPGTDSTGRPKKGRTFTPHQPKPALRPRSCAERSNVSTPTPVSEAPSRSPVLGNGNRPPVASPLRSTHAPQRPPGHRGHSPLPLASVSASTTTEASVAQLSTQLQAQSTQSHVQRTVPAPPAPSEQPPPVVAQATVPVCLLDQCKRLATVGGGSSALNGSGAAAVDAVGTGEPRDDIASAISSLAYSTELRVLIGGTADGRVVAWTWQETGDSIRSGPDSACKEGRGLWNLTGWYQVCRSTTGTSVEPAHGAEVNAVVLGGALALAGAADGCITVLRVGVEDGRAHLFKLYTLRLSGSLGRASAPVDEVMCLALPPPVLLSSAASSLASAGHLSSPRTSPPSSPGTLPGVEKMVPHQSPTEKSALPAATVGAPFAPTAVSCSDATVEHTWAVAGSQGMVVRVWSLAKGAVVQTLQHTHWVMAVSLECAPPLIGLPGAAGSKSAYLLSGAFDGRSSLFRAELGRAGDAPNGFLKVHSFLPGPPPALTAGCTGTHSGGGDNEEELADGVLSLLISAQRDLVVAGFNSGLLCVWSLGRLSSAPIAVGRQANGAGACSLAWCGSGAHFLAGSEDGICKHWEYLEDNSGTRREPTGCLKCIETASIASDAEVMALACSCDDPPMHAFCGISDGSLIGIGPTARVVDDVTCV